MKIIGWILFTAAASFGFWELMTYMTQRNLELKDGTRFTVEASPEEFLRAVSGYNKDASFSSALELARQRSKTADAKEFVKRFGEAFNEVAPGKDLVVIFATAENLDWISSKSSNAELLEALAHEADTSIEHAYHIISSRINLHAAASVITRERGKLLVEVRDIREPENIRKLLQMPGNLQFWETWRIADIFDSMLKADSVLRGIIDIPDSVTSDAPFEMLLGEEIPDEQHVAEFQPLLSLVRMRNETGDVIISANGPVVGYCVEADRQQVSEYLAYDEVKAFFPKNIKFLWGAKPVQQWGYALYAIKTFRDDDRPPLDGSVVKDASEDTNSEGEVVINMEMDGIGKHLWQRLTGSNVPMAGQGGGHIAIVVDDLVYVAPEVFAEITNGKSVISGDFTTQQARTLAHIINAGRLPAPVKIISEDVIEPQVSAATMRAGKLALASGSAALLILAMILVPGVLRKKEAV